MRQWRSLRNWYCAINPIQCGTNDNFTKKFVAMKIHTDNGKMDPTSEDSGSIAAAVMQEERRSNNNSDNKSRRRRRRAVDGDGGEEIKRCGMWLPSKRRFCASYALPTSSYCGNHDPSAVEKRVPCPVDPSHTVLEHEVAVHVKKCQATKHLKFSEEQTYFCKGVNAGSDGEEDTTISVSRTKAVGVSQETFPPLIAAGEQGKTSETCPEDCTLKSTSGKCAVVVETSVKKSERRGEFYSSAAKRSDITALGGEEFLDLVTRIESSYEASCAEVVEESFLQPPQCLQWWDRDRDRRLPFQEKHVSQQASMLGNLEAFGLLKGARNTEDSKLKNDKENRVYVEFGAGRGYLSQMLCDSYGVSSVVLVERKAYKYKADRTLRQLDGVSVERLRTDIEDLKVNGVQALQGRHYVAVSKHLCGPATDFTLRCCMNDSTAVSDVGYVDNGRDSPPALAGIGIATCCHHICQWKPYVNKDYFREMGFSESDFNMITWLTSWAVNASGENADADHTQVGDGPASVDIPRGTENAGPRLSEAMDSLDVLARTELGRKSKHLIDFGRLEYLRQHGLDGKIVKYISASVSPENKLLLARR